MFESRWEGECNIGTGERVTLREICEKIGDLLGRRSLLQFGVRPAPDGEPPVIVADVTRLKKEVGWVAQISLEKGLQDTIDKYRQELGASVAS